MTSEPALSSRTAWRALVVGCVVVLLGVWLVRGSVNYYQVNVTWRSGVAESTRRAIADSLSLRLLRPDDDDVWICMLADTSRENRVAILKHPSFAGVRFIDEKTLEPTEVQRMPLRSWLSYRFAGAERLVGPEGRRVRPLALIPVFLVSVLLVLMLSADGRRWLIRRVPVVSPTALGVFRIVFATALILAVGATVEAGIRRTLSYVCLALFGAGVGSRVSFAGFVLLFTVERMRDLAAHDIALPLRTLWLLLLVPWGNGLSVDEWVRRVRGHPRHTAPSRRNGLAMYIPILMLGLAYAAAAFAKLDENGLEWVTRGAAGYFFVIDGYQAPVRWGRMIASSDTLSVLFSAGAITIESLLIVAAIVPKPMIVAAAGLGALALHTGFYLFQGVWWPMWWVLLVAFVPWEMIARRVQRATPAIPDLLPKMATLSPIAAAILFVAVIQQPIASYLRAEYLFLVSDFPMYSDLNFESKEAYAAYADEERQPPPAIRISPVDEAAAQAIAALPQLDPDGVIQRTARTAADKHEISEADRAALKDVAVRYGSTFGATPANIALFVDRWRFDWSVADFVPRSEWKRVATVNLAHGTIALDH